jgi:TonB family protein
VKRRGLRRLALLSLVALAACGRGNGPGAPTERKPESDRAFVTLPRVAARGEPSANAHEAAMLTRGAEVRILGPAGGFARIKLADGKEAFLPVSAFERLSDREAREKRSKAVASFAVQPGRINQACPVLLAPDYGAARWGELKDGDDVAVLLADHDFYGVRLDGELPLGYVPARSVRLMPPPEEENAPRPTRRPPPPPAVAAAPQPTSPAQEAPRQARAPESRKEPYELLPSGADPPALVSRVEPVYPEIARRLGAEGEITLKIVVEADGSVGRVTVEHGGHPALVDAAVAAVKRWRYRPARVDGSPVPVFKTVRIRFTLKG